MIQLLEGLGKEPGIRHPAGIWIKLSQVTPLHLPNNYTGSKGQSMFSMEKRRDLLKKRGIPLKEALPGRTKTSMRCRGSHGTTLSWNSFCCRNKPHIPWIEIGIGIGIGRELGAVIPVGKDIWQDLLPCPEVVTG